MMMRLFAFLIHLVFLSSVCISMERLESGEILANCLDRNIAAGEWFPDLPAVFSVGSKINCLIDPLVCLLLMGKMQH